MWGSGILFSSYPLAVIASHEDDYEDFVLLVIRGIRSRKEMSSKPQLFKRTPLKQSPSFGTMLQNKKELKILCDWKAKEMWKACRGTLIYCYSCCRVRWEGGWCEFSGLWHCFNPSTLLSFARIAAVNQKGQQRAVCVLCGALPGVVGRTSFGAPDLQMGVLLIHVNLQSLADFQKCTMLSWNKTVSDD